MLSHAVKILNGFRPCVETFDQMAEETSKRLWPGIPHESPARSPTGSDSSFCYGESIQKRRRMDIATSAFFQSAVEVETESTHFHMDSVESYEFSSATIGHGASRPMFSINGTIVSDDFEFDEYPSRGTITGENAQYIEDDTDEGQSSKDQVCFGMVGSISHFHVLITIR